MKKSTLQWSWQVNIGIDINWDALRNYFEQIKEQFDGWQNYCLSIIDSIDMKHIACNVILIVIDIESVIKKPFVRPFSIETFNSISFKFVMGQQMQLYK